MQKLHGPPLKTRGGRAPAMDRGLHSNRRMLGRLRSAAVIGVEASLVDVEIDVSYGLPAFAVVGLPDSTVRESRDRVRSAIRHAGFEFPERRITANLAPADVRKSGASYDLPIALGLLAATGSLPPPLLEDLLVVGALSLDGRVQPVRGVLPVALLAARHGHRLVLPAANRQEGSIVEQVALRPAATLAQIVADLISGAETAPHLPDQPAARSTRDALDLVDVRGQRSARRAVEIAAAGRHNLLLVGPPGAGKTLLARRLPGILPRPTFDEAIASTAIHSVAGLLEPSAGLLAERPFRAPHHSASDVGIGIESDRHQNKPDWHGHVRRSRLHLPTRSTREGGPCGHRRRGAWSGDTAPSLPAGAASGADRCAARRRAETGAAGRGGSAPFSRGRRPADDDARGQ